MILPFQGDVIPELRSACLGLSMYKSYGLWRNLCRTKEK